MSSASGGSSALNPTPGRLGSYSSRSEKDTVAANLEEIQTRLKKVSANVVETRDEFVSLSDRSKDNGVALESLMAEIKSFVAISNTHHTNQVRELARLNQLDQLEKLEHLDKLGNHVRDLELQQRELNARMDLWKKFDEDGLFDQIKQLNTIPAKLKSLEKLENLDQLKMLADLKGAVDAFKSDKQVLGQIQRLGDQSAESSMAVQAAVDKLSKQLDQLERASQPRAKPDTKVLGEVQRLGDQSAASNQAVLAAVEKLSKQLDQLEKANQPQAEPNTKALEALSAKLDASDPSLLLNEIIAKLDNSDNSRQLQGEVRAIQDHLLGEHDDTRKELEELRCTAQEQAAELERFRKLHESEEALAARVEKLEQQEKVLLTHNTQLKTELKSSAQSLASAEAKYRELESHVREVMLSKYQAAVETTSLPKDREIVIPKRRNAHRSVSLQNN